MFPRMLMKLVSLRTLSSVHSEQVFALRLQDKKLPPLLSEIWDVNEWLAQKLPSGLLKPMQTRRRSVGTQIPFRPLGETLVVALRFFLIFYVERGKYWRLLSERLVSLWRGGEWTHFCWAFCGVFFFSIFCRFCHYLSGVEIPISGLSKASNSWRLSLFVSRRSLPIFEELITEKPECDWLRYWKYRPIFQTNRFSNGFVDFIHEQTYFSEVHEVLL